jgi:hypothetical protein
MKKATQIIVIIFIFFVGCNDSNKKQARIIIKDEYKVIQCNEIDSVISSEKLREALLELIYKVDSIPNPFGRSVCYSLSFYKKGADTLLSLEANIFFPEILEKAESNNELKGLFSVQGYNIALYDYKESLGSFYYDKNELKAEELLNRNDNILKSYSDSHEGWTFVAPYILFRIKNRKLIRIDSYFGN